MANKPDKFGIKFWIAADSMGSPYLGKEDGRSRDQLLGTCIVLRLLKPYFQCGRKYYNATKFGVGLMDQMTRKYSVESASRRWRVHVFSNVLDFAYINA
ncbi:hypothetical protein PR048_028921 [Dryococelus australis]|uniref:PiggyBac transposable element-derived protein domain-containing protein n=1 Tax=Dryococelus australis TaxID=614101 RepID=A0ABQ9GCI4_9NEOP|nr:hypothetical protein PR048_028921 [Dryococelus australis]